jgi:hypothetical protein
MSTHVNIDPLTIKWVSVQLHLSAAGCPRFKSPSLIKKVAARPIIIVTCSAPASPIVATHNL